MGFSLFSDGQTETAQGCDDNFLAGGDIFITAGIPQFSVYCDPPFPAVDRFPGNAGFSDNPFRSGYDTLP